MKRILAAALAAVMLITMSACTTTTWIAKVDGEKYPSGVYLIQVINKANEAAALVPDKEKPPFSQEIEGVKGSDWIDAEAKKGLAKIVAIRAKFNELGLELSDGDMQSISMMTQIQLMYYGETYRSSGIADTSVTFVNEAEQMNEKIFMHIYGEGGEKEVPKEEMKKYYDENYISVSSYQIPLKKQEGETTVEIPGAKEIAADAVTRLEAGEDFYTVLADIEAKMPKSEEEKAKEKEHSHAEGGREHDMLIDLTVTEGQTQMPQTLVEKVKTAEIGAVLTDETEDAITICKKNDTVNDTEFFENAIYEIRAQLKGEEYDALTTQWGQEAIDSGKIKFNNKSLELYASENLFVTE